MSRRWSSDEVTRLASLAGSVPKEDIAAELGRSPESVAAMAKRMRAAGIDVPSLRASDAPMCPACGRHSAGTSGICEPCRLRRQIDEIDQRMAEELDKLDARQRDAHISRTRHGTPRTGQPKPPRLEGLGETKRKAAMRQYERRLEAWEAEYLFRKKRTHQKRLERVREIRRRNDGRDEERGSRAGCGDVRPAGDPR